MRFSHFAMVGAFCALVANVAVITLVRQGFGSLSASALAFGPVLVMGYALHSMFTFRTRPSKESFLRYALGHLRKFSPVGRRALSAR